MEDDDGIDNIDDMYDDDKFEDDEKKRVGGDGDKSSDNPYKDPEK